ncbi:hypothetical protein TMatcc_000404 [Talaromyces marneffei ATCC 18224]
MQSPIAFKVSMNVLMQETLTIESSRINDAFPAPDMRCAYEGRQQVIDSHNACNIDAIHIQLPID